MVTIEEFAIIALWMYRNPKDKKYFEGFIDERSIKAENYDPKQLSTNYQVELILDKDIQEQKNNLYPTCFLKVVNQKPTDVIIGIRGTANLHNAYVDAKVWWKEIFDDRARIKPPYGYQKVLHRFGEQVIEFTKKKLGLTTDDIYVTGHSLGGALSALIPTLCNLPIKAVTFNAPGIHYMSGVDPLHDKVVNIRSSYDFVSFIGKAVGPVYSVSVPIREREALRAYQLAKEHERNAVSRLNVVEDLIQTKDFAVSAMPQHSMEQLLLSIEGRGSDKYRSISSSSFRYLQIERPKVQLPRPFLCL